MPSSSVRPLTNPITHPSSNLSRDPQRRVAMRTRFSASLRRHVWERTPGSWIPRSPSQNPQTMSSASSRKSLWIRPGFRTPLCQRLRMSPIMFGLTRTLLAAHQPLLSSRRLNLGKPSPGNLSSRNLSSSNPRLSNLTLSALNPNSPSSINLSSSSLSPSNPKTSSLRLSNLNPSSPRLSNLNPSSLSPSNLSPSSLSPSSLRRTSSETYQLETHQLETHQLETHQLETHQLETHQLETQQKQEDISSPEADKVNVLSPESVTSQQHVTSPEIVAPEPEPEPEPEAEPEKKDVNLGTDLQESQEQDIVKPDDEQEATPATPRYYSY